MAITKRKPMNEMHKVISMPSPLEIEKRRQQAISAQMRKWAKELAKESTRRVIEFISPSEIEHEKLLQEIANNFDMLKKRPLAEREKIVDKLVSDIEKVKKLLEQAIDEKARKELREKIIEVLGHYLILPETKEEMARYKATKLGKALVSLIETLNLSEEEIDELKSATEKARKKLHDR